jgi:Gas vesicle synthesis protein GvpL/GvpF
MSVLLYAVAEDELRDDPPGGGIDGLALRTVRCDRLAAIVSAKPEALESTERTLVDYERAVERLMEVMTVLPARFGTVIGSDNAVAQLLRERHREFTAALERVRGAVELDVRAEWLASHRGADLGRRGAGTAYIQGRLRERHRSRELASEVDLAFSDVARAGARRTLTDSTTAFSASYLVGEADVDDFLRRLDELENATEDATFVCTGPWPPYSFAGGEAQ